jgi:hypothetical protein
MKPLKRIRILYCNGSEGEGVKAHLDGFVQENTYIFGLFFPVRVFQGKACGNHICIEF